MAAQGMGNEAIATRLDTRREVVSLRRNRFFKERLAGLKERARYLSIVQRKALTPKDFPCLEAVAERLSGFERYYESIARPFEWKLTRADLNALLARMQKRYGTDQR